jgi:hypothetical protein
VSDSSFRRIEAVGWVMWVALAAAVTLPVSARAKKSLSWRKDTFIVLILYEKFIKSILQYV